MKTTFLLIVLTFTCNSWSFAGEYSCPETHLEYSKILEELQIFQKKLREELKCQEIAVNFEKLTGLVGAKKRSEILSFVSSNQSQVLSAENAKKIQDYAEAVTEEVGVLVSMIGSAANGELSWGELFMGTDRCSMEEQDQLDGIEWLIKATYEVTNLVSKIAGPYGVPLQIGVSTIYGVVQGLQNYSVRAKSIDFDTFEKRQFFESAVCIMSKFDSDIRKLNNPDAYLRNLTMTRAQASRVVDVVRDECESCKDILDAGSIEEAKIKLNNIGIGNSVFGGRAYESKANLEWIDSEIKKFNEIVNFKTRGIGSRELQSLNISINKFILGTAAPDFLKWYAQKASVSNNEFGDRVGSLEAEMRDQIYERGDIFEVDLPFYIIKEQLAVGASMRFSIMRHNYMMYAPEILSLFFIKKNKDKVNRYSSSYYSLLGEAYEMWKLSDSNIRVVQEYCAFFEDNLKYRKPVENACEAHKFVWHRLRIGYQSFYLADLIINNGKEIMKRLGPFDFRLKTHYDFLKKFKNSRKWSHLRLAENDLDFDAILENERRSIRKKNGRLDVFENDRKRQSWWEGVQDQADNFLNEFHILNMK